MSDAGAICLVMVLKRRPDISTEEFSKYWTTVHGPLIVAWALQYGAVHYKQLHNTGEFKESLTAGGNEYLDCDGIAFVEFKSPDDLQRATADPFVTDVIGPDEDHFLDKKTSKSVGACGKAVDLISNGKPMLDVEEAAALYEQRRKKAV